MASSHLPPPSLHSSCTPSPSSSTSTPVSQHSLLPQPARPVPAAHTSLPPAQPQPQPPSHPALPPFSPHRPHACPLHKIKEYNYATCLDPRGYIPVYEYSLAEIPSCHILWDRDTGYVLWTNLCKAVGIDTSKKGSVGHNSFVDLHPNLMKVAKKIRGGNLKIQGTW
jgi:hypothetical protein